jgi:hypothetical protein
MIKSDNDIVSLSGGGYMPSGADIIKDCVTEFSRIQDWMIPIKDLSPETYESMHKRYIELKVTLTSLGVNITELDRIKA